MPVIHRRRFAVLLALGLAACAMSVAGRGLATDAQKPRVTFGTTHGTFVLELYPAAAPATVANFLGYVRDGYFEGIVFHRVIAGFMIQGGGFTSEFARPPTRAPIRNEADNGLANDRGTIAMARTSDPHSATAQFFINVVDNDFLNHRAPTPRGWGYAVFGKVVDGMETVDRIAALPTGPRGPFRSDVPQEPVVIERVTFHESE